MEGNEQTAGKPPALHPFLVGSLWVLSNYRLVQPFVSLGEMLLNLGAVLLGTVILYSLLKRVLKTPFKASVMTTLLVVGFCFVAYLKNRLEAALLQIGLAAWASSRVTLPVLLTIFLMLGGGIILWKRPFRIVKTVLNLVAGAALAVTLLQVLVWPVKLAPNDQFPRQPEFRPAPAALTNAPDIYYLVLDSHTSLAALHEYWGYDSAAFAEFLRQRGFTVVTNGLSQYSLTPYCISSIFNLEFVPEALARRSYHFQYAHLAREIAGSFAPRQLRSMGYQIVNLSLFPLLDQPAFYTYPFMGVAGFHALLLEESAWRWHWNLMGSRRLRQANRDILARVEQVAAHPGQAPRFVYAHLMMPHPPFFYDRNGREVTRGTGREASMDDYLDYLIYSDRLTTNLVTRILAGARRPTVIVLQGDHGFRHAPVEVRAREATQILNAFHLPGGATNAVDPVLTPVNTFRLLFNRYFGTAYPMLHREVVSAAR